MKKNQERRLHRKNAKIVKEGGTPMQLNRPVKPDTTVSTTRSSYLCDMELTLIITRSETVRPLWADGTHE